MSYYSDMETDRRLNLLEKRISKEYSLAAAEMKQKADDYFDKLNNKRYWEQFDAYQEGKYTKAEFDAWYKTQVQRGEGYRDMVDKLCNRAVNANQVASALINDTTPGIWSLNYNYEAYRINQAYGIDFQLFDEMTLKVMFDRDNHVNFKHKWTTVDPLKAYNWNKQQIDNALISGILQGKTIDQLAGSYLKVMGRNESAAIRNARTSVTSAQNAGRMESYDRAKKMGINLEKEWMSTLDSRTRESHKWMDGERKPNDDEFSNGLMYPGDPDGDPAEVYNCRCTMRAILPDVNDSRYYARAYKGESGHREYDAKGNAKTASGVNYKGKDAVSYMDFLNGSKWEDQPMYKAKEELAKLVKDKMAAQSLIDAYPIDTYTGIWKNDITTADWEAKHGTIQAKKDYYNKQMIDALANNDQAMIDDLLMKHSLLEEFDAKGQEYYNLVQDRVAIEKQIAAKQLEIKKLNGYDPMLDPYSQERKDAAVWAKTTKEADDVLRQKTGEVWKQATKKEREAIYDYTWTYSPYNEPLRGITYGQGGTAYGYKGVGKVDLNGGKRGESINLMTDILNKSSYSEDMWLQRGCRYGGMDKFFNIDANVLRKGTQEELENALLGNVVTEHGFMSTGVAKGKGFSGDIIMNIYAPEGTNMMYAEPFSKFGNGAKSAAWDGVSTQSSFGYESEMILQQGTQFRITKVERTPNMLYVDLEVIGRTQEQRWIP